MMTLDTTAAIDIGIATLTLQTLGNSKLSLDSGKC
jgi:hypothetical protein